MKMLFRLFWLFLTQSRRSRTSILGSIDTPLRVYPNDLDIYLHVNNGVYLTYADLGRTDLMLRSSALPLLRKQGWYPVVAAATIQFKKSLTVGQRFKITTHVVGWTDRAIYMEQIFTRGTTVIATVLIDARFLAKAGGKVSMDDLFSCLGLTGTESPELPESVQLWLASRHTDRAAT